MTNINYLFNIIKEEGITNNIRDSLGQSLYQYIKEKYDNIIIDYKKTKNTKYFNTEINKYKKKEKEVLDEKDLKNIINLKNICSKINTYINFYFNRNKNLHEQLLSIKINGKNITELELVEFERKNKHYEKELYFF